MPCRITSGLKLLIYSKRSFMRYCSLTDKLFTCFLEKAAHIFSPVQLNYHIHLTLTTHLSLEVTSIILLLATLLNQ